VSHLLFGNDGDRDLTNHVTYEFVVFIVVLVLFGVLQVWWMWCMWYRMAVQVLWQNEWWAIWMLWTLS